MERKKILVTAAGSEIANPVIKSLQMSDLYLEIIGVDIAPFSPGLYKTSKSYIVPRVSDGNYDSEIIRISSKERIDLIIPGSDLELLALSRIKEDGSLSCDVAVASSRVIELTLDKQKTYEFFKDFGLPFVKTVSFENVKALVSEFGYPIIAKPKSGSASSGVYILFSEEELVNKDWTGYIFQDLLVDVTKFGNKKRVDVSQCYRSGKLVQEKEISVQVNVNSNGEILNVFASDNVLKSGMPVRIVPFKDELIENIIMEMTQKLIEVGLRGPCNFQCKMTGKGLVVFEINARFTGITGVRESVGYKEVEAIVRELVFNESVDSTKRCFNTDYEKVIARNYDDVIIDKNKMLELEKNKFISEER